MADTPVPKQIEQLMTEGEQGNAEACFQVAEALYAQKQYKDAFDWYLKTAACKAPNPVVYFNIAYACQTGQGTPVDMASALDYYEKAASCGLPQALYNLAFFYQNGIMVKRDEEKAMRLCREADVQLNTLRSQLHLLQSDKSRWEEQWSCILRALDDANSRASTTDSLCLQLREDNASLRKRSEEIGKALSASQTEAAALKASLAVAEKENLHTSTRVDDLEAQVGKQEKKLAEKDAEISAAAQKVIDMCARQEELSEKYQQMAHAAEDEFRARQTAETAVERLTEEKANVIRTLGDSIAAYQQQIQKLTQKNRGLQIFSGLMLALLLVFSFALWLAL